MLYHTSTRPPVIQPYSPQDEGTLTAWLRTDMACQRSIPTIGSAVTIAGGMATGDGTSNTGINQSAAQAGSVYTGRWNLGTNHFSVKFDVSVSANVSQGFFTYYIDADNYIRSYWLGADVSKPLYFEVNLSDVIVASYAGTWTPTLGQKYTIEWERSGADVTLRVDGVMVALTAAVGITASTSFGDFSSSTIYLLRDQAGATYLNGSMGKFYSTANNLPIADYPLDIDYFNRSPARNTGSVGSWLNYTGVNHVYQATSANRPTYTDNALGTGLPGLVSDDTDVFVAAATTGGIKCPMPVTFFMGFKWQDGETTGSPLMLRGDNWYMGYASSDDKPFIYAGSIQKSANAFSGSVQILAGTLQSGNGKLWVDAVKVVDANTGAGTTASTNFIQGVGTFGETIVFPSVLSDSAILRIINYLQRKYGLAVSGALT